MYSYFSGAALPPRLGSTQAVTLGGVNCPGSVLYFPSQTFIAQPIIIPKPPPNHPTEKTWCSLQLARYIRYPGREHSDYIS